MKKSKMPESTYKVLVYISVVETQQSTEELLTDNCICLCLRDFATQTDPAFVITREFIREFTTCLFIWFLWALAFYCCK